MLNLYVHLATSRLHVTTVFITYCFTKYLHSHVKLIKMSCPLAKDIKCIFHLFLTSHPLLMHDVSHYITPLYLWVSWAAGLRVTVPNLHHTVMEGLYGVQAGFASQNQLAVGEILHWGGSAWGGNESNSHLFALSGSPRRLIIGLLK